MPNPAESTESPLFEPERLSLKELRKLIPQLKQGGYVIYIRHATTDYNQEDKRPVDLNNCKTQRNLTKQGRKQAQTIGRAFRQHHIPVGQVISSPYCRCLETAKLAFGQATRSDSLYFAMGLKREGKEVKGVELRNMLMQAPAKGKNTVIVSHTANLQEAVGLWPKPEGASYIFKIDDTGELQAIAIVEPDLWLASLD